MYRATERMFDWILKFYEVTLSWVLRHQPLTMVVTLATVGFTVYLYVIVPKGFFPQQDTGRLTGNIIADQDTSFQQMSHLLNRIAAGVSEDPDCIGVIAFTGGSGNSGGATNAGRMFVSLRPIGERTISADEVIGRIRRKLAGIPGVRLFLQAVQDLRIGGRSSSSQYQFTLQGDNLDELNAWGPKVLLAMARHSRHRRR